MEKESKIFFSVEKKQKTFQIQGFAPQDGSATAHAKSFGSFLQKRTSSSLAFPPARSRRKFFRRRLE
jgi:hypothetical protein